MSARVYVAGTLAGLARWHEEGRIPEEAERVVAEADDEDSEYAALMTAAAASAALGAGDGRRVVVVAEVDAAAGPIAMSDVVAVHCDTEDRGADADPDDDLGWFATQEIPGLI
ncbi:MAG TPA: hypothetical protein VD814_06945 [Nocardioides sp.]|nr:hypothetical protein [Nocardioides sp.]